MKFRSRFTGQLKLTHQPEGDEVCAFGQSRQVVQTEILDFSVKQVSLFGASIASHVKAGLLVPVDSEAKSRFPKAQ